MKCEVLQQQRATDLTSRGRTLPSGQNENDETSLVFDLDTERGLNRETLCYDEAKQRYEMTCGQIGKLRNEVDALTDVNENLKNELETLKEKLKLMNIIMNERQETEDLTTELGVIEEELSKANEKLGVLKGEEDHLRELLDKQESELCEYRTGYLNTQEKYEQGRLLICRTEEANAKIAEHVRSDIECFRDKMEGKLAKYRALPAVLGVTRTQCFQVEEVTRSVVQDSTLLGREIEFYSGKVEALLSRLAEHKEQAATCAAQQAKIDELRTKYDEREHRMNKLRQDIATLTEELNRETNRVMKKSKEIDEMRHNIANLKEEYAMKLFNLKEAHEKKKQAQLVELNRLELDIVRKRGLIRAIEMEQTDSPSMIATN